MCPGFVLITDRNDCEEEEVFTHSSLGAGGTAQHSRAIQEGQKAGGLRGEHGEEPLLWFLWKMQANLGLASLSNFSRLGAEHRACLKLSGTWPWGDEDRVCYLLGYQSQRGESLGWALDKLF
jgi:hypothetical protein